MNEQEALSKMVPPAGVRKNKPYRGGVIQVHITRGCDKSCFGCTQGSNLKGKVHFMSPELFAQALDSLEGYWGVIGVFGGNPALHPQFEQLCEILKAKVPYEQRGLWCNNPITYERARVMRDTFNPHVSNLNVHLDQHAYDLFKQGWPECNPVGLTTDSRHAPPWVAMKDVLKKECVKCDGKGRYSYHQETVMPNESHIKWTECDKCKGIGKVYDEERAWELISNCDINQQWSAMIGVFRGELRSWFCEVAGAQSILHQDDPEYPDTGLDIMPPPGQDVPANYKPGDYHWYHRGKPSDPIPKTVKWWELPMHAFTTQVRKHCHECGIPLRGYGELAQAKDGTEQVSHTHRDVFKAKDSTRRIELVTIESQVRGQQLNKVTAYLQNARV